MSLSFLFFSSATAQIADFKNYTVREGLLSNAVATLCQDGLGYLWIGTSDGVSVYDGVTFRNYTYANGLPSSLVNCIMEDRLHPGVMWIGTNGGGVSRYEEGTFTNYRMGRGAWSDRINGVAEDSIGDVYCATDDGIYELKGDSIFTFSAAFRKGVYEKIYCSGDSLLFAAENGALISFNIKNGRYINLLTDGRSSKLSTFVFDSRNRLWISHNDGTVTEYGSGIERRISPGGARAMVDDHRGGMWLLVWSGLYKFNEDRFGSTTPIMLSDENGLRMNDLTSVLVDREGDLWVGYGSDGISKLSSNYTLTFNVDANVFPLNNSGVASDKRGHIWALAKGGVLEIWRQESGLSTSRKLLLSENTSSNPFISIQSPDGESLWLGSMNGQIIKYEIVETASGNSSLQKVKTYFLNPDPARHSALCLYVDKFGRAWFSFDRLGVYEIDTKIPASRPRLFGVKDGILDNSSRAMFTDSRGNLWLGGYISGLFELSLSGARVTVKNYTTRDGLPDNSVRAVIEDDSGSIWIGTRYGGIAVLHDGKIRTVTVKDGLISDAVWAMAISKSSGILFGTQLGLQGLQGDPVPGGQWREFTRNLTASSCGVTSNNLIWVEGATRLEILDLATDANYGTPPPVYITDLHVNGNRVPIRNYMKLPYYRNTLTFDFAGISLRDEGRLRYSYILRGADGDWREASGRAPVTYVSIKPGSYTFEVKAINTSGMASINSAAVSFTITPPFWSAWWFIVLVAAFVVSTIYFGFRLRISRVLAIERVRSRIATDLHDDIGSGLTRIAILADVALKQEKSTAEVSRKSDEMNREAEYSTPNIVDRIGANARELVDAMSDVVWSIDPKNMTMGDLINRLRSYAYEMCEGKGVALALHIDESLSSIRVDPDILRTLLLVAKEALNNSIKHSGCRSVSVGLRITGKSIELGVSDDGRGFTLEDHTGGHGLINMRHRAEQVGGDYKIKSSAGSGTRVTMTIPMKS